MQTSVLSDETLIREVALKRDEKAFEVLAQRHAPALYTHAFRLLSEKMSAEDAVQAALLDLWRCGASFSPARGTVRSWLLRLVTHKALKIRSRAWARTDQRPWPGQAGAGLEKPGDVPGGRNELRLALQKRLTDLPELDRQLVTMAFGAGLTQMQIARRLRMPQTTISRRIRGALRRLERDLRRLGFGAGLEAGLLDRLLRDATGAPTRLNRIVAESLGQHAAPGPPGPLRVASGAGAGWKNNLLSSPCAPTLQRPHAASPGRDRGPILRHRGYTAALSKILALALLCGVGLFLALGPSRPHQVPLAAGYTASAPGIPSQAHPGRAPQAGPVSPPPTPLSAAPRARKGWDFSSSAQLKDFLRLSGRIEHQAQGGPQGGGCLTMEKNANLLVAWPVQAQPLRVSFRFQSTDIGTGDHVAWARTGRESVGVFYKIGYPYTMKTLHQWHTVTYFLTEHTTDRYTDQARTTFLFSEGAKRESAVCLSFPNSGRLADLVLEQIAESEVPDYKVYEQIYRRLPLSTSAGIDIPIPELKALAEPGGNVLFQGAFRTTNGLRDLDGQGEF